MFSWFRKRKIESTAPALESAPDPAAAVEAGPSLLETLARVLNAQGHAARLQAECVELDNGLMLRTELLETQPAGSGVRTSTYTRVSHPRLGPHPVCEYQHSWADSPAEALAEGFRLWVLLDLPVLSDAIRDKPADGTCMEMSFPEKDGRPGRHRRVILGPCGHYRNASDPAVSCEDHPFCPCCFFTRSFEAFRTELESEGTYGIRFFAARNSDGSFEADCRVNATDNEAGRQALLRYASTWPERGFEYRKQYVFLQDKPEIGDDRGQPEP